MAFKALVTVGRNKIGSSGEIYSPDIFLHLFKLYFCFLFSGKIHFFSIFIVFRFSLSQIGPVSDYLHEQSC